MILYSTGIRIHYAPVSYSTSHVHAHDIYMHILSTCIHKFSFFLAHTCTLGWSLKKIVYLQVEIERYGGKISFPVQKNS